MVELHLAAWGNGAVLSSARAQSALFAGDALEAAAKAATCESAAQADELRDLASARGIKAQAALV
eukprot:1130469-Alexandrium_andersonii.AAC.1